MSSRTYICLVLLAISFFALFATARDKQEDWLEVRSSHFVVVTNSNEKQARHVADQFERMRSVFHTLFPKLRIDPDSPIVVLAIKDEKNFRALEPAAYLAKGQLKLGGLFLRGPDKNYVLMRLDAEGEHPYAIIYHEYTHLLLSKAEWIPLWLNEGLAEYYQNTDIHEKDVALGQPSPENLQLLRENRLLPLATLFTVDQSSPYYHEENKGSIFYAESWALIHYLQQKQFKDRSNLLADYLTLVSQNVDPVAAGSRTFGDLKQLQSTLDGYVRQAAYQYFRMPGATDVDDTSFQVQALTTPQADAIRADFLAYNLRMEDARTLLDRVLQQDPNNTLAHETMGFLAFREQHLDEARKWYAEAVKLDSQSYLAHYYFAAISMQTAMDTVAPAEVESSLRASIKLNPNFAPSYDRLAVFLAMHHDRLDEARLMELSAIQLDPGNLGYRINTANILMQMGRPQDAITVIRNASRLAKSPMETAMADNALEHAQEYAKMQERNGALTGQAAALGATVQTSGGEDDADKPATQDAEETPVPNGPHHFLTGVLKNVHCKLPAMDLDVVSGAQTLGLHTGNYFKVEYSSLNVTLKGNLNPCADLEGKPAKVEYVNAGDKNTAVVVAIEIHK
jgi:tetratricopeptide (TPR) repeat protein